MVEQTKTLYTYRPKEVDVKVETSLCKTADGVWTKWVVERLSDE